MQAQLDRLQERADALLARRAGKVDLTALRRRYTRDPVAFIRTVLHGEPWSAQVEIAEAVRDHPRVAVRSCNGAGKDWLAAHLAVWAASMGWLVLLTGPTLRQVKEVLMAQAFRAWMRAGLGGEFHEMSWRIGRGDEAGILAFTSNDVSRLTGLHAPRVLAIVTEAQGCEPYLFEGVQACLTGVDSRLLVLGNPIVASGAFARACVSPRWKALKIAATDHPNVREGREVIPGGVTAEFCASIEAEWGRASGVYRARVEAEFPVEGEDGSLCYRSWFERAVQLSEEKTLEPEAAEARLVAALDVARLGPDRNALLLRQGPVIRRLVTWRGLDLVATTDRLRAELGGFGIFPRRRVRVPDEVRAASFAHAAWTWEGGGGLVAIDEVGVGAGCLDATKAAGYETRGFSGGRRAIDDRRFADLRSEAAFAVRRRLEKGLLAMPREVADHIADEACAIRYTLRGDGRIKLESKDDYRSRTGGASPDLFDALCMSEMVERVAVPRYSGVPVRWSS